MAVSAWGAEEEAVLVANFDEHGGRWEGWNALLPGKSANSIASKARRLGLERHRPAHKPRARRVVVTPPARATPDPMERPVMAMMARGMTPGQIDARMRWVPGRARQIVTEMWSREEVA